MPDVENKPYITNSGRRLLMTVGAGKAKLIFTNCILYSQDVKNLGTDAIEALANLDGQEMTAPIGIADINNNSVTMSASFNNQNLTQDISFNSVGWWGHTDQDTNDVLLLVTALNQPYPISAGSPDKQSTASVDLTQAITMSDSSNVTVNMVPAGEITKTMMDSAITEALHNLENKVGESVTVNGGAKVTPDANHNFAITVPNPDLSGYARTITVNGGSKIYADSNHNIPLNISQPDMSKYAKSLNLTAGAIGYQNGSFIRTSGAFTGVSSSGAISLDASNIAGASAAITQLNQINADVSSEKSDTANLKQAVQNMAGWSKDINALSDLIRDVNDLKTEMDNLKKNQFLVQSYKVSNKASAQQWSDADPTHRMAIITTN